MVRLFIGTLVLSGFIGVETNSPDQNEQSNNRHKQEIVEKLVITNDSLILWSASRKLTWNDFQGSPNTKSKYKALTFVQIGLKSEEFDDRIDIETPTYFYKKLSWSKSLNNSNLLKHEQLHFDIGELIARKIRRKYATYELKNLEDCYKELKSIYRDYYGTEFDRYNKMYDEETDHGTIATKQKEWELKISKELKSLNAYVSTKVVIKK